MKQKDAVRLKRKILVFVTLLLLVGSALLLGRRMYYGRAWNDVHALARRGLVRRLETVLRKDPSLANADLDGSTPLHMLIYTPSDDGAEVVRILVKYGAAVDALSRYGTTPLCYAAEEGKIEAVKALIYAGADPTAGDPDMGLPVEVAAQQGHDDIVRFLNELARLREPDG